MVVLGLGALVSAGSSTERTLAMRQDGEVERVRGTQRGLIPATPIAEPWNCTQCGRRFEQYTVGWICPKCQKVFCFMCRKKHMKSHKL